MKIIFKFFLTLFFLIILLIFYSSLVGFETKRFNSQIKDKIQKFDKNLKIDLDEIKIVLNPLNLD